MGFPSILGGKAEEIPKCCELANGGIGIFEINAVLLFVAFDQQSRFVADGAIWISLGLEYPFVSYRFVMNPSVELSLTTASTTAVAPR